jgi:mRNA interferase HicA
VKKRQLERHLTDHGCRLTREAANHELWENPATGQRTTVPRHRDRADSPVSNGTALDGEMGNL